MLISCDECGNDTFHLNFKPPLRCDAVCTDCGNETEIGKDANPQTRQ